MVSSFFFFYALLTLATCLEHKHCCCETYPVCGCGVHEGKRRGVLRPVYGHQRKRDAAEIARQVCEMLIEMGVGGEGCAERVPLRHVLRCGCGMW